MIEFAEASLYDLPFEDGSFDLVLCCEVLEHVERPREALAEVARVGRDFVLISTPWEPVWRVMNMARGKYLRDLGNTPGHIQHFGRGDLIELAETRLEVVSIRRPLPWTVILGKPRS
jgi:SAM-dependent methyltransferase